jgi:hypothetical protein
MPVPNVNKLVLVVVTVTGKEVNDSFKMYAFFVDEL